MGYGTALFRFSAKYLDWLAVIIAVAASLIVAAQARYHGGITVYAVGLKKDSIFSTGEAFYIALSFFGIELGKLAHDNESRE
jgi:hypothetical protein